MILGVDKSAAVDKWVDGGSVALLARHADAVRVAGILRRQAGVISRRQAIAVGVTARQIHRLLAVRQWLPVHPGVFLASDRELTTEGRVRAAALWAGEPVTVSGVAAAWWLG